MTWSRTLTGSALPILLSLAFVGVGAAKAGSADPTPGRAGSGGSPGKAEAVPVAALSVPSTTPRGPGDPDDEPAAVALLQRAVRAAASLSYSGTQFVGVWGQSGSGSAMVEVVQQAGGARQLRAVPVSGAGPGRTAAGGYRLDAAAAAPALDVLLAVHRLRVLGSDTVAGRPAVLLGAERGGRPAARLWLDRSTGLLLRLEVLDGQGRLARSSGFVQVHLRAGAATPPSILLASAAGPQRLDRDTLDRLRAQGWPVPADLPGGFRLHDSRRTGLLLHLTYTDGLSGVSVFLQPGRLDSAGLPGFAEERWGDRQVFVGRDQWPLRVVWQDGQRVATVIADTPDDRVRAIVAAFPAGVAPGSWPGLGDRLRVMLQALPGR